MDRTSILSGAAFKAGVLTASAFTIAITALTFFSSMRVSTEFRMEIDEQLLDEQRFIEEILDDRDQDANILQAIQDVTRPFPNQHGLVGLFSSDGRWLAGNLQDLPGFLGWGGIQQGDASNATAHRVHVQPYNGFLTVVGRDLTALEKTMALLIETILVVCVITALFAIALGYFLSRNTFRKLADMEHALALVANGETDTFLTVGKGNDQVDRIARQMNTHLSRLFTLMSTTRSASAALAHDLKTPLARSSLALEKAEEALRKGDDAQGAIASASKEHRRLARVFDTILRIARIEESRGDFGSVTFNLLDVATEMADTYAPLAEDHRMSLSVDFCTEEPVLLDGDPAMIRQLLSNLIQNAISHCPPKTEIELQVRTEQNGVVLAVQDSGPGIARADFNRVFDPFYRADKDDDAEGTGLGLTLVKAIADRHGALCVIQDTNPGCRVSVHFDLEQRPGFEPCDKDSHPGDAERQTAN